MRIIIIEDDPLLGDGLGKGLTLLGYAVDWFRTARDADASMQLVPYDAVILDLGLPGEDGMALLARWRSQGRQMPVLVLTARDAVESRIHGLDTGADDYLIKPLTLDEIAARLRAVTRRSGGRAEPVWTHGNLRYRPASKEAWWADQKVELTAREAAILEVLLTNPNRVLSRDMLREKLYSWDEDPESNSLEVHVHHLRRKIHPQIVRTVRGLGYALGTPGVSA